MMTHGRSFELYVVHDGAWALAGRYRQYLDFIAALQVWERYFRRGGTVKAWLEHSRLSTSRTILVSAGYLLGL